MVVHCFFEQSGTFKNEFRKLGFKAYDYDILNDFNKTDFCVDLFNEIEKAYSEQSSIFDNISSEDLIIAFFPCVRFSNQSYMMFQCTQKQLKNLSDLDKISNVINFHNELSLLYNLFCKFYYICLSRNFRVIIENPYSNEHYLTRYFPLKPKIIDIDRRERGDNFKKPTQYWFLNFEPKYNFIFEPLIVSDYKYISFVSDKVERSLINSNYANRFIREFIL